MHPVLRTCIDIETRIAGIYQGLADHPQADGELQEIWTEMAEDELRHAKRIHLVADRLELAGMDGPGLSAQDMQRLLDRTDEVLEQVIGLDLSLVDAIYASVELEDEFLKAHLNYADVAGQPDLQTLFKFLAEEDRQHTVRLRQYLARLNDGNGLVFEEP